MELWWFYSDTFAPPPHIQTDDLDVTQILLKGSFKITHNPLNNDDFFLAQFVE
jgi:hypothetical protein